MPALLPMAGPGAPTADLEWAATFSTVAEWETTLAGTPDWDGTVAPETEWAGTIGDVND